MKKNWNIEAINLADSFGMEGTDTPSKEIIEKIEGAGYSFESFGVNYSGTMVIIYDESGKEVGRGINNGL